ncbi:MAG TPA: glycosyltransferase family 2 protein [Vicinamibacterales bacterium]|nr:glycosyltransferase family 2 protein [Vicinamibacterales bacterium]
MKLSVGIPVFNEQEVLPKLLARLLPVLDGIEGGPHEVIFVDDGSTDSSRSVLADASSRDPRIRVVVLSRNFGHQAALGAALDYATGNAVVLMDADLQDQPEMIPAFVARHRAGADVVFARRRSREEGWLLRLAYRAFYRLISALSDTHLPLDTGDFALLGQPVVAALRRLPEHERYLRGLRAWVGFTQVGLDVDRQARAAGKPKYTTWKLMKLAVDGVCSFSIVPLRAAAATGLVAIAGSVAFSVYSVWLRLAVGHVPQGFTASIVIMTFLSGVQLLFLGVIGEYLGRVYGEAKGRPPYVVARVLGDGCCRPTND